MNRIVFEKDKTYCLQPNKRMTNLKNDSHKDESILIHTVYSKIVHWLQSGYRI